MEFNLENFIKSPSQEEFIVAKKSDLLDIAAHYNVPGIKASMRKQDICNILIQTLVDDDVLSLDFMSFVKEDVSVQDSDLKLQLEKLRMEREERLELQRLKLEEKKMEREREEREREERERVRETEREERERDRQFQLELKALERANQTPSHTSSFDVSRNIRLVPPFQEKDVDKYFLHFEKVAENLKWPREHWTLLLQTVLLGKAREIYTQLSIEQCSNYDTVKDYILKGYELVPEAYRQKFRNCKKETNQTHVEFARTKTQLFDRWCSSKGVEQDHAKLRQLMLIEEFKRCIQPDIKTFIDEKQVETLDEAARLADDYSLTHKVSFVSKPNFTSSLSTSRSSNSSPHAHAKLNQNNHATGLSSQFSSHRQKPSGERNTLSNVTCNYCKKTGHLISDCLKLKEKQSSGSFKPTGLTTFKPRPQTCVKVDTFDQASKPDFLPEAKAPFHSIEVSKPNSDSVMDIYEPFMSNGFASLSGDSCPPTPIRILRDTGASQSLILADTLPFSEKSFSGVSVVIQGVECGSLTVPLHNIVLSSTLVSGSVSVGLRSSLPFEGVHLLLGNDLAGDKVVVNPLVTDTPIMDKSPDPAEREIPDLYPSCAVTRSMASKAIQSSAQKAVDENVTSNVDLADTFIGQIYSEANGPFPNHVSSSHSDMSTFSADGHDVKHDDKRSRSQLVQDQHNDPDISCLFEKVLPENEISCAQVGFYVRNGVLMRKWRPPDVAVDDDWAVNHQIVVPRQYRHEILSLAHESPMSGHLGITKTYNKILNHFFWPGLKSDVSDYCNSCHTCQMVGKPNQNIPKAPLQPIPAFDEPFSRIIIDCVGPLPKTKSGNQYLLTIMCASTRFPEAIPLRNIQSKSIVKALVKFFTFVGLPKSVQSDQGSNFMSGVFKQVMHELGIKQYRSSAYHPESQGALERFHQTLKNMMRTYCFDTEKSWDDGIPLLLFAVRESIQESLGFSPFELVFGHTVRGPLKLLKEKFLSDDDTSFNLLKYVSDFRERLSKACDLASTNLKSAQGKMKERYDHKTQSRSFNPGDQVLALLPIPGNPLQARYFGPYIVEKKVSDLNYIVLTPGRRKQKQMCHVNMLKLYIDRNSQNICKPVTIVHSVPPDSDFNTCVSDCEMGTKVDPCPSKLNNSDILRNIDGKFVHLEPDQKSQLKQLVCEFKHLFPDVPTRTDKIQHDVIVENEAAVKQHPYRMNPAKQQYLKDEIKYLLDNDFIEPSQSKYSSPCILVPKPDGTYRLCTDYRKINNITKTDSYPIPRMDDCIDKVGKAKFVTKFDLLKGFWQVPLTDRAKELSAFVTPDGLYQFKVMPFGMKNSPATFQRLINSVISGLGGCDAYIDDVIIYSETFEEQLDIIRSFFNRLSEAKLTINLEKSEFCHATLTFLGHVVGQGHVKPIDAKVLAISEFPIPTCKKQLMRFLGMAGYYRKFCKNFSDIAAPLTNLLKKGKQFIWDFKCQAAFDNLKAVLKSAPILLAPDFDKCFSLAVDASDVGAGAVLLQSDSEGIDHPVCYFSKKFNKHQRNYSTIEKECLALILAIQHFEVYLTSSVKPIVVYSDHNPLKFLHKLKNKNQRLLRWSLLLQEFDLEIKHIKGKDNVIPDALSRV